MAVEESSNWEEGREEEEETGRVLGLGEQAPAAFAFAAAAAATPTSSYSYCCKYHYCYCSSSLSHLLHSSLPTQSFTHLAIQSADSPLLCRLLCNGSKGQ